MKTGKQAMLPVMLAPRNQRLVGCKHGSGSIQDARMHSSNSDIVHNQSQYSSQHKSYYVNN